MKRRDLLKSAAALLIGPWCLSADADLPKTADAGENFFRLDRRRDRW